MNEPKRARGAYAKGVLKREEILERALEVIARDGYAAASVKNLAKAVGLSQAGLLHYFGSKDELFVEILRKRDEVDSSRFGDLDAALSAGRDFASVRSGYIETMAHNTEVPGLVELFTRLAGEAADPNHPAHAFFQQRQERLLDLFTFVLDSAQRSGEIIDTVPVATLARLLQATTDGLQAQWLLDPTVDMLGVIDTIFDLLKLTGPQSDKAR
ncbi:MAG: TetR/AcrR family transcriptional regulator [Microbacteriaceae bacterium]|nr:TetR/AcrR family transcriptional regulator [Microbacteriaceae bacterium]